MTAEGFHDTPSEARDYHRTGSRKNVRAKMQGKDCRTLSPGDSSHCCNHALTAAMAACTRPPHHQAELMIDPGGTYGPHPSFLSYCLLVDSWIPGEGLSFSLVVYLLVTPPPGSNGYFQAPGFHRQPWVNSVGHKTERSAMSVERRR